MTLLLFFCVCAVVAFVDDGDGDEPTDRSLIPGVAAGEDDRWTNLGWDNVAGLYCLPI